MEVDYVALGRRVRDARRNAGLTQTYVSEQCGLSTSFYGHIERGSRKASIESILAIGKVLNCSPNDLLQDSVGVFPPTGNPPNTLEQIVILIARLKREMKTWESSKW